MSLKFSKSELDKLDKDIKKEIKNCIFIYIPNEVLYKFFDNIKTLKYDDDIILLNDFNKQEKKDKLGSCS